MATSKKMAVVTMVFMAAVLLLATVESAAAAATATATATATTSDSSQQLGLGATRKLLQIVGDTCGGNDCSDDFPLGCCAGSPVCRGICSTLL
jgi:hypothetical protein